MIQAPCSANKQAATDRRAGILLHITSLPSRYGVGDFGPAAAEFIERLVEAGQSLWQILPINPTGFGNSPYQSPSAFAGNPLLVSPELLREDGLLSRDDLARAPEFPADRVDFDAAWNCRWTLLERACQRFASQPSAALQAEFEQFRLRHAHWLDEYALFAALKAEHGGRSWIEWAPPLIRRQEAALAEARVRLRPRIDLEIAVQFFFFRQWRRLKELANAAGVLIVGDAPIFVAHDSADAWSWQELFHLDAAGRPTFVAGVPPDYFSADGQLWGNPLYRWDALAERGYDWWLARLRHSFELFDAVRLDHFRGFEAYWEVPAGAPDARRGRWAPGPRAELFRALQAGLGKLPIIAEDLGVITPPVEALRDDFGLPGMRVLQFAFGDDPKAPDYLPHNYVKNCVVYTGTHDNDTTVGWFRSQAGVDTTRTAEQIAREQAFALEYMHTGGAEIHWDIIRLAWSSTANWAIVPMQDILGLESEARMNRPGSAMGNWGWRLAPNRFAPKLVKRLRQLTEIYGR